ncbi:hypothetical protein ABAC460_18425 [Asticcacaulis sp. AC460]|uniref:macro domain-containing protein n=1 Tax=Asticcacaulis sp. AC460 TaxID=1282360 RepID=UPI0003C40B21|nr:macro domain-containing protein [Asticcacaulis sp. AC460]ESQ87652.1 hypothetical protein ABAC460_18425 [Asticcacaulis sp. AC460]
MKIVLATPDDAMAAAWEAACHGLPEVILQRGSILDLACDAIVSPANSFGFMDGGLDLLYSEHFGWDLQLRLRRRILDHHHGELLVGQAEIVETGNDGIPFMIAAPTMRVPMYLGEATVNPYLATRAALLLVRHGALPSGEAISSRVTTVAFPAMGTGVGRVPAAICARQMRQAFHDVLLASPRLPTSWAEASEDHQRLYTDSPTRLQ